MLPEEEDLTDYERARNALIARNRERMAAMGLLGAANAFETMEKAQALKAKESTSTMSSTSSSPKKKKPRPRPKEQPTRTSKRLRGERAPGSEEAKTEGGAGQERSPSPPPEPRWTEAELREIRAERERKMGERLAELDIAGLIDYSPGLAHFAIVGAPHKGQKGRKHYVVTFSKGEEEGKGVDKKTTATTTPTTPTTTTKTPTTPPTTKTKTACECMDFRVRQKRRGGHCKHIRLVMAQLGIDGGDGRNGGEGEEEPAKNSIEGWESALERVVMKSASAKK